MLHSIISRDLNTEQLAKYKGELNWKMYIFERRSTCRKGVTNKTLIQSWHNHVHVQQKIKTSYHTEGIRKTIVSFWHEKKWCTINHASVTGSVLLLTTVVCVIFAIKKIWQAPRAEIYLHQNFINQWELPFNMCSYVPMVPFCWNFFYVRNL